MRFLPLIAASSVAFSLTTAPCRGSGENDPASLVAENYAEIAAAVYNDCLTTAKRLQKAVDDFLASPSPATLATAREAWLAARVPYGQSEVFRFYDGPIDGADGPEGLLNAWPMDEAYLDYVEGQAEAGIIQNPTDFPDLTAVLLVELNEKEGETNISTGYHAIEFLLWGQDLSSDGPGNRPHTDYTTAPHAERRATYLRAVTALLIEHLEQVNAAWAPDQSDNYRATFLAQPPVEALQKILTGMGLLAGFELAGERMFVALASRAQEDEHSCFSDNTHVDIIENARGILNVVEGVYRSVGGKEIGNGKGIAWLLNEDGSALAEALQKSSNDAVTLAEAIPSPFDQVIVAEESDPARQSVVEAIEQLRQLATVVVQTGAHYDLVINIEE